MKLALFTRTAKSGEPSMFRILINADTVNKSGLAGKELQATVEDGKIVLSEKRVENE